MIDVLVLVENGGDCNSDERLCSGDSLGAGEDIEDAIRSVAYP